jgi:hypothetical protein
VNRIILCLAVGLAVIAPARQALCDDKPTKEQLEQAKAAFAEGKSLHDQGKLPEAVDKFKESYRLSKNPLLLYNIGLTLDEAGQKDNALLYYRKFLSDAPANAAQRPTANDRVKVLEKEKLDADLNGGPTKTEPTKTEPVKTEPVKTEPVKTEPAKPIKIKPAGTYSASDFQHQLVDSAPPGKPLDVSAFVPEDSGFTVTLYYRAAGDATFTAKQMKWRYKELVARVPAAVMKGSTIQYYIEVKDQAGNKVTSSGKSTNPNLVTIDASASPRYYTDMPDDDGKLPAQTAGGHTEEEDPLAIGGHHDEAKHDDNPMQQPGGGDQKDTTPSGPNYVKWGATGAAGVLLGTGIATYFLAKGQANNIQGDTLTNGCTMPPCRAYDHFDSDFQSAGQSYQTISNVTIALGVIGAGVAGFLWSTESTTKKHDDVKPAAAGPSPEASWIVAPAVGDSFRGAAAAVRW